MNQNGFKKEFSGTTDERLLVYQEISNILNRRLESPIITEYNHVFDEFKNFVTNIE